MYCPNCGKEIDDKAVVCVGCGVPTKNANQTVVNLCSNKNNWLVVLLLCLFLGMLGVHRFYTGHTSTGIIQLVLTITFFGAFITGIWVLIDLINILLGNFKTADGQELVK